MPTTKIVDGVTQSMASWGNDVDSTAYSVLTGVAGTNTITATGPANYAYAVARTPLYFIPAATNTGATTVNITPSGEAALGAKNVFWNGAACVGGELRINVPVAVIYDGTRFNILGASLPELAYPSIFGLETSNNATDATNDIDIAVGETRDSTDVTDMVLAAALTKRIDASWVVGTNQGMLDGTESVAGTPDNDTFYFIWLIMRSDTSVVDVLASESSTAPTMPTNYDRKQLIGVVRRGTATNLKYYQDGDTFRWEADIIVLSAGTATVSTAVTLTTAVPSIAKSFSAVCKIVAEITQAVDGFNTCIVRVASGVDYAILAHLLWGASGSARRTENTASLDDIPNTGTFEYRNSQSNTNSRSSTIYVQGFKLARGTA